MRTITEVIAELEMKGIKPYQEHGIEETLFFDYSEIVDPVLRSIFHNFFIFGQTYLERKDLEFDIEPARLYFSSKRKLNALARKKIKEFNLIEIFIGTIEWMKNFYLSKAQCFDDPSLKHFEKIAGLRQITPSMFLLQLTTIYYFYHEVGHLIQGKEDSKDYLEYLQDECQGEEIAIRHMRELDADWFSAHCTAMHLKQFAEVDTTGNTTVDPNLLEEIAALGIAGMYMYFIDRFDKTPNIYYQEKCHPHPVVRLSYMLIFILNNLQGNVPYPIDKGEILRKALKISDILMRNENESIISKYSILLNSNARNIEDYINKIIRDTDNYPYLAKHHFNL